MYPGDNSEYDNENAHSQLLGSNNRCESHLEEQNGSIKGSWQGHKECPQLGAKLPDFKNHHMHENELQSLIRYPRIDQEICIS